MAKNQKSYTPEFKQQIVDLYNAGGTSYPQLEREYGVNRSTISGWVKQLSPIKVSEVASSYACFTFRPNSSYSFCLFEGTRTRAL